MRKPHMQHRTSSNKYRRRLLSNKQHTDFDGGRSMEILYMSIAIVDYIIQVVFCVSK